MYTGFHKNIKQHNRFQHNVDNNNNNNNVSWAASSRDTEDWSNDAENSALHHYSNREQLF